MLDFQSLAKQAVQSIGIIDVLKHLADAVESRDEKQALLDCRRALAKIQGRPPEAQC